MTELQKLIERVLEIMGPQLKYPYFFMDHPDANELIDGAPKLARALKVAVNRLQYEAEKPGSLLVRDTLKQIEQIVSGNEG